MLTTGDHLNAVIQSSEAVALESEKRRIVPAVHGNGESQPDPSFELELSAHLKQTYDRAALHEIYGRFMQGEGEFDSLMRRVIWRAIARRFGQRVRIGSGVGFKHL